VQEGPTGGILPERGRRPKNRVQVYRFLPFFLRLWDSSPRVFTVEILDWFVLTNATQLYANFYSPGPYPKIATEKSIFVL